MSRSVFIIDDEPDCREAMARFLDRAGYDVQCFSSGKEAIALLGTTVPDAVVLDYQMPEMDGVAVLEVFRSYLRWAEVPVIIVSAFPDEPRLWHVSDYGVRHVIAKSGNHFDEVLECLRAVAPAPTPSARIAQLPNPA